MGAEKAPLPLRHARRTAPLVLNAEDDRDVGICISDVEPPHALSGGLNA
jgi:hypothetical protein